MASTSASTFGSSVAASAPPAAGQHQHAAAGFHAMPSPSPLPSQQQQTFHLTPEMEQGLKAALGATNPDPASHSRKNNRSAWIVVKYFLRYTILLVSVGIVVAEFIIAMTQRANLDTAIGVVWGILYACWHTWRLVRILKKKGTETITPTSLIIDGLLVAISVICIALLMWKLIEGGIRRSGYNEDWAYAPLQSRGVILIIISFIVGVAQSILFRRTWVEHEREHNQDLAAAGGGESAMSAYPAPPPPPPAQIVVHYVQNTCPKCGTQSWPQPGEEMNEHMASKGDMQPQAIPLSQLQHLPRAAG